MLSSHMRNSSIGSHGSSTSSVTARHVARSKAPSATAAPPTTTSAKPRSQWTTQDRIEYLKEDLSHLFDDKGIDPAGYEKEVDFCDPITKYGSAQGYLFNIRMLKLVFNPRFILHDIKQTSDNSITTRWTMDMEFSLAKRLPLVSKLWSPSIIFTGTSEYVFNPETGRIFRHIDEWDSIRNQKYFSLEGAGDFLSQLTALYRTPEGLETPPYTILKRRRDYQVRKYEPFLVAECAMDATGQNGAVNPAGPGTRAFNALAGFIFGGNAKKERMSMTTPVLTSSTGKMQFVIPPSAHKDLSSVPAPTTDAVQAREQAGGLFAVRQFSGRATELEAEEQERLLRKALERDGEVPAGGRDWVLARYNDPSTPAFQRRNEVLIPLDKFELWR